MITFLKNTYISILQNKHQKMVKDALRVLKINKKVSYRRIEEAEKLATKIQSIRKYKIKFLNYGTQ